jgi:hypothetical protein
MISEIIWSLVGMVWLIISIYFCFILIKYGTPFFKKMFNTIQSDKNNLDVISQYKKIFNSQSKK